MCMKQRQQATYSLICYGFVLPLEFAAMCMSWWFQ